VCFFEQRLQSIVELDAVARDLILASHHGPPEPLFGVGHKAQGELLGHQTLHEPFGVRKVLLPTASATIRLRLRKVERPRQWARAVAVPALRPPVQLQRLPDGSPILRGRLHHDFLDPAFDEPVREGAQFTGARPHLHTLEAVLVIDFDVSHDDGQHLLVHIDSGNRVRHRPLLGGSGERASLRYSGSRAVAGSHRGINDAQLFGQSRTLRTRQLLGFDGSTGCFDLTAPRRCHSADTHGFSCSFAGCKPRLSQLRKSSRTASQTPSLRSSVVCLVGTSSGSIASRSARREWFRIPASQPTLAHLFKLDRALFHRGARLPRNASTPSFPSSVKKSQAMACPAMP